jgi:hypothetical protein
MTYFHAKSEALLKNHINLSPLNAKGGRKGRVAGYVVDQVKGRGEKRNYR